jgi:hypothetical protein
MATSVKTRNTGTAHGIVSGAPETAPADHEIIGAHVTGDGILHATREAALAHADTVARNTGRIVAVEQAGPESADGDRCVTCRGLGLVRGVGKNAGGRYRTLAGAQQAQEAGRAKDCPSCEGTGISVPAPF